MTADTPTPDLVERLREQEMAAWSGGWRKGETRTVIREAAAEIERLQAENADQFRTLAAVLITAGVVKVPDTLVVQLDQSKITSWRELDAMTVWRGSVR